MTAFAAEEAKVAVHSTLSLLLGQLAVFSEFGREVGFIAVERVGGGRLELWEDDPELLLLLLPELPLFELELFFLLSDWLLGFADLLDLSALLELAAFSRLILE